MREVAIDQLLLQALQDSGDSSALVQVCRSYTLFVPLDAWDATTVYMDGVHDRLMSRYEVELTDVDGVEYGIFTVHIPDLKETLETVMNRLANGEAPFYVRLPNSPDENQVTSSSTR
jgi:hypothetical protein